MKHIVVALFYSNANINNLNKQRSCSLIRFIRLESHINLKNSFLSYPKKKLSSDCDIDLVMSRDLDCLALDWLRVVTKDRYPFQGMNAHW